MLTLSSGGCALRQHTSLKNKVWKGALAGQFKEGGVLTLSSGPAVPVDERREERRRDEEHTRLV